jgi:hypothetical protein
MWALLDGRRESAPQTIVQGAPGCPSCENDVSIDNVMSWTRRAVVS